MTADTPSNSDLRKAVEPPMTLAEIIERLEADLAATCPPGSSHAYALVRKTDLRALLSSLAEKEARVGELERERDEAQAENARLRQALERVKVTLTIPAAEYVPAIPDAWAIIDTELWRAA